MARPNPGAKAGKRGKHGDAIAGLPGQPEIITHGGGGGPKKIKGPGANASVKGGIKGSK